MISLLYAPDAFRAVEVHDQRHGLAAVVGRRHVQEVAAAAAADLHRLHACRRAAARAMGRSRACRVSAPPSVAGGARDRVEVGARARRRRQREHRERQPRGRRIASQPRPDREGQEQVRPRGRRDHGVHEANGEIRLGQLRVGRQREVEAIGQAQLTHRSPRRRETTTGPRRGPGSARRRVPRPTCAARPADSAAKGRTRAPARKRKLPPSSPYACATCALPAWLSTVGRVPRPASAACARNHGAQRPVEAHERQQRGTDAVQAHDRGAADLDAEPLGVSRQPLRLHEVDDGGRRRGAGLVPPIVRRQIDLEKARAQQLDRPDRQASRTRARPRVRRAPGAPPTCPSPCRSPRPRRNRARDRRRWRPPRRPRAGPPAVRGRRASRRPRSPPRPRRRRSRSRSPPRSARPSAAPASRP